MDEKKALTFKDFEATEDTLKFYREVIIGYKGLVSSLLMLSKDCGVLLPKVLHHMPEVYREAIMIETSREMRKYEQDL